MNIPYIFCFLFRVSFGNAKGTVVETFIYESVPTIEEGYYGYVWNLRCVGAGKAPGLMTDCEIHGLEEYEIRSLWSHLDWHSRLHYGA